ncbi:unnamed protein product, partial [Polarella glacialis]
MVLGRVLASGRVGEVLVTDLHDEDSTYKLQFSDGQSPEFDWLAACKVELVTAQTPSENEPESVAPLLRSLSEEGECPLCLDTLAEACRAPCSHIFCRACILKAMRMTPPSWRGDCPLCRRAVSVYTLQ